MEPSTDEAIACRSLDVDGFAMITQTCDVTREWKGKERKWVILAPVVKPPRDQWRSICSGSGSRYHTTETLKAHGLAIDLERMQTFSKLALAKVSKFRRSGCSSQSERRMLAEAIGDKLTRPALPDDLTSSEAGHEGAIAELEGCLTQAIEEEGDLGHFLRATHEIRLMPFGENTANPWETGTVEVLFYFIMRVPRLAATDLEQWEPMAKDIVTLLKTNGRFRLRGVGYKIETWNSLSAAELKRSDRLA